MCTVLPDQTQPECNMLYCNIYFYGTIVHVQLNKPRVKAKAAV